MLALAVGEEEVGEEIESREEVEFVVPLETTMTGAFEGPEEWA